MDFFSKTGVGLPEEVNSIFHQEDKVYASELATMSFGQELKVTPLQLITAISAIANDGVLMKPKIVKEIVNTETNAVTSFGDVRIKTNNFK